MKICSICKETKPFSDFGKKKNVKSGFAAACLSCCKARKLLETATKFGHLKSLMTKYKRRAKDLSVQFDLDIVYLESIACDFCPIFNTKLNWGRGKGFDVLYSPSLDRLDPNKGYVKGNVAFMSFKANRLKNDSNIEDIRKLLNWMEKQ
mgnify:CR=1 FL=1